MRAHMTNGGVEARHEINAMIIDGNRKTRGARQRTTRLPQPTAGIWPRKHSEEYEMKLTASVEARTCVRYSLTDVLHLPACDAQDAAVCDGDYLCQRTSQVRAQDGSLTGEGRVSIQV
jgi:hypothetical protein